eukprot:TRINITY_DN296_c0_g1_i2.p2 TRINITY_DN296_c0_g1~~TRINITY_DN296_c0_g1_i2.p2  ORF type:complete len:460 (+),score=39.87 TRINITY_DN296_c0_g1_i2:236-1615(+)
MRPTLQIFRKFKRKRQAITAQVACQINTGLLRMKDPLTQLEFLIDTGASVSVVPASPADRAQPEIAYLYAANNSKIPVYKRRTLRLSLELRRQFVWEFYVADVSQPILGADFLSRYGLIVDLKHRRLLDSTTHLHAVATLRKEASIGITAVAFTNRFAQVIKEFPTVRQPYSTSGPLKHSVTHRIETTGRPTHAKARRLAPERSRVVKAEFDSLIRQGIIRPSASNWSSALHVVPKKNGDIRPCGDYRALNAQTAMDRYPIPNIQEFASQLAGNKVFTHIDLVKAFHQIPIHPSDIAKTAVVTPFGLFEYVRMPFGLRNAAQSFQRFIDEVLRGLPFVYAYIDDLLIASPDEATHEAHLRTLLQRLSDYGLQVNEEKCVFGAPTVDFLGHTVSSSGITPLQSKCEAITKFPRPTTQKQLQQFLGMINYYNRFIPKCSLILSPLYAMIQRKKLKAKSFVE